MPAVGKKMKRKNICLLTVVPETKHGQRMIQGAARQCVKYGYNLSVFSPLVDSALYVKKYYLGEKKIFDIINYSYFDGIILDMPAIIAEHELDKYILDRIESMEHGPLVCVGSKYEGYVSFKSTNRFIFEEMCRHMVLVHGKKKICLLTGQKDNEVAEFRLQFMKEELQRLGVTVPDEYIRYGNFWYTSGEILADDIIAGKIPTPEAVICASDHMGLGLIERLRKNGIRVPEDVAVIGFEGTTEAAVNEIPLTSYCSNYAKAAADAVDYIAECIEPGVNIDPMIPDFDHMLHLGRSCGCNPDTSLLFSGIRDVLYFSKRNYNDVELIRNGSDIGLLMENYVLEQFTDAETPQKLIDTIFENVYNVLPYRDYYLCLREDWLTALPEDPLPEKMRMVLHGSTLGSERNFCHEWDSFLFNAKDMLPDLSEDAEPSLFYFSPIHFFEKFFGYSVLRRNLDDRHPLNLVYRNWLRFINNALEMVCTRNRFVLSSVRDEMTGLLNRRGMYEESERLVKNAGGKGSMLVGVIDMDGLKYINDNYSHFEGDEALKAVSAAIKAICSVGELAIRGGGDEFFFVGVGDYPESIIEDIKGRLEESIAKEEKELNKPFPIKASIGFAVGKLSDGAELESLLKEADFKMYEIKQQRKHRN